MTFCPLVSPHAPLNRHTNKNTLKSLFCDLNGLANTELNFLPSKVCVAPIKLNKKRNKTNPSSQSDPCRFFPFWKHSCPLNRSDHSDVLTFCTSSVKWNVSCSFLFSSISRSPISRSGSNGRA